MSEFISPAKRRYEQDQQLMINYVNSHPEMKPFIDAFTEVQKAYDDGRRAVLSISIGKSADDGFYSYLTVKH